MGPDPSAATARRTVHPDGNERMACPTRTRRGRANASEARGARTRQPRVPPTPAAAVRHDLLLGAAAHAAEVLTSTPDLRAALAEAGRVLGEATGVDRVNVFRYDHARAAGSSTPSGRARA
jgi:hypothetical protein